MKKNLNFNWESKRFEMEYGRPKTYTDETAAENWIEQVIRTPNDAHLLFPSNYGTITNQLVGKRTLKGYYEAELERTIKESIKFNPYIESITNLVVDGEEIDFQLNLKEGVE